MLNYSKIITLLMFFCTVWFSCNANIKLQHIIDHVNNENVHWKAGVNHLSTSDYKNLVGTKGSQKLDKSTELIKHKEYHEDEDESNNMLESFDARYHWFECTSISHVWNQGNCAADWAIAVTSTINDRICIKSKQKITALYSPQKLLSCCKFCGNGCSGGYPGAAWNYWVKKGLVTGGDYNSEEGCQPWLIPPCNQTIMDKSSSLNMCGKNRPVTPKCDLNCYNPKYYKPFLEDIKKGKMIVRVCPGGARKSIKKHGPITAIMRVYEDFLTYKSGIYQHVTGQLLGQITVKVIGWGISGKGVRYWLAVNSWGTSWGENGVFKIRRGYNDCMFEDYFTSGIPTL